MDYLLLGKVDQSGKVRAELRVVQKQLKRITAMRYRKDRNRA